MDYFATMLVGFMVGFGLCWSITTPGRETQRTQQTVCAPYVVLASYKLLDKKYVICGDKEHREYK